MFKLINVFDVWINPNYITNLEGWTIGHCNVNFTERFSSVLFKDRTCDQVAEEINKQMEKVDERST